ncbi:hypothetical protein COO60DRAFT_1634011 [Scenedesmus sp. NREL 46B-D3]|nr:hypothetical protein COO60DRAFT_1634011 [Scenedesmus sp. NREL 46B-D3]
MQIKVQPRIQRETWSLYWKEPTKTTTQCLEAVTLDVGDPGSSTVAALMDKLNWPPEDGLVRLENFKDPWQRALCRGWLLAPDATLTDAGVADGDVVTVVRIELVAEGWKIKDELAFSSDSEEEEAD